MASCRVCGDDQLDDEDMCPECWLCEICCVCGMSGPEIDRFTTSWLEQTKGDKLSDMEDEDRGYYWERH